ncbi:hypothetical protein QR680_016731 [Steinernema hermaphroditum]|uniref:Piwi domain-containing protein n=1 Tax=Steinernema hermaphroditum TaxID=289476 RepID=A0AA39LMX8_9BILA|nr:hypothetical protein QR680_016731 [Steinernema hermaphroditum]
MDLDNQETDVTMKRRMNQLIDKMDELCQVQGIQRGDRVIAEKKPAGSEGQEVEVQTNVFNLKLPPIRVHRYDVKIIAQFPGKTKNIEVEFTKKARADYVATHRKERCRDVFELLVENNIDFFGQERHAIYYDCQAIMYTVHKIPTLEEKSPRKLKMRLSSEVTVPESLYGVDKVTVELTKVHTKLRLNDLSFINQNDMEQDQSLQQFLQLLINQHVIFSPDDHVSYNAGLSYLVDPKKYGFTERDCPPLYDGKCVKVGCERSVQFVEGPDGEGNVCAAMMLDTKRTAFHDSGPLVQKVAAILPYFDGSHQLNSTEIAKLNTAFKGLFVKTCHTASPRSFPIHGVVESTASQQQFNKGDGEYITIAEYLRKRYSIDLNYPNLPLVTIYERRTTSYYPMELLSVCENQRVLFSQQTPGQLTKTLRVCAVPPIDRALSNRNNLQSLELKNNLFLKNAQVKVASKPMMMKARVIGAPELLYGNREYVRPDNGSWRTRGRGAFVSAASVQHWVVLVVSALSGQSHMSDGDIQTFVERFIEECRRKGLQVSEPSRVKRIPAEVRKVEDVMERYAKSGIQYALFITDDSVKNLHKPIKLLERNFGVITQDVRLSTALTVVHGKWQTLHNIVAKTNVKLGGINYEVELKGDNNLTRLRKSCLVVGFAVNHSKCHENRIATAKQSTVFGFAANVKKHPDDFVGDYFFEEAGRTEKSASIMTVMESCVRRFHRARGFYPSEVIVFRNGASDGQYGYIQEYEIPMIERAMENSGAVSALLTVVIPQKAHNFRLLPRFLDPSDHITKQNVQSGTVLDHGVVHPLYTEYYLNSHAGVAGSSKTPRYTVLYDQNSLTMDDLQNLTHSLCFGFQIIKQAVSLPAPVVIAARYAERGRALLDAADGVWLEEKTTESINYADLNKKLSYKGTGLENFRVNA